MVRASYAGGTDEVCDALRDRASRQKGPPVFHLTWSATEKKVARRVFDAALAAELAEIMAEFKAKAAAAAEPDEMWPIQEYLDRKRREINLKYDYRYSQLLTLFGRLLAEGRIQQTQLDGLSEEKLAYIRLIASP